jgi:hypothetical protein
MIYGLIVYVNDQSIKAFEFGEQGMTTDQVHAAMQDFLQGRQRPQDPGGPWDQPGSWGPSGPPVPPGPGDAGSAS